MTKIINVSSKLSEFTNKVIRDKGTIPIRNNVALRTYDRTLVYMWGYVNFNMSVRNNIRWFINKE
jgi:hypothetical protein